MTDHIGEMDRILSTAQARMDADEPAKRDLLSRMAYPPPPGDGYLGNLPWLTEDEAARLAALRHLASRQGSMDEAAARIAAKIMRRKAQKLNTSGETCAQSGGV